MCRERRGDGSRRDGAESLVQGDGGGPGRGSGVEGALSRVGEEGGGQAPTEPREALKMK